ncbi:hypothetical protein K474DRAFT_1723729, partial [Panus rudis PR-1116 ss-1]
GSFKDHLVTWVGDYLKIAHADTPGRADEIMAEIDRRIAAVPPFPGLRNFYQGRDFKQWTGDDSKGLMKVYLPALVGLVPDEMVKAIKSFLEFAYLARMDFHTEATLAEMDRHLQEYHWHRKVFLETGVRMEFDSLPRQHALKHYVDHIRNFGALNGLSTSITESKHIKAIKEPWRRSSRWEALGQMLVINQRLDKLAAATVDFKARGMLEKDIIQSVFEDLRHLVDDEEPHEIAEARLCQNLHLTHCCSDRSYPPTLDGIGQTIGVPELPDLVSLYMWDQEHPDAPLGTDDPFPPATIIDRRIHVFHSASTIFYAPSDPSGRGGMKREHIRAAPTWRRGPARYDRHCVFVSSDSVQEGFRGLMVARVRLFFSFAVEGQTHSCALVDWFSHYGNEPDDLTGMWIVTPDFNGDGTRTRGVISLDAVVRGAHLIPVYGEEFLPSEFHFSQSLDSFQAFYVNKFVDYHAYSLAF